MQTHCSFDVFGVDGKENRLLKKALLFVQRYLPTHKNLSSEQFFQETFLYIIPAFEGVSENVSIEEVNTLVTNPFFKEYKLALSLAKQILKRFGYAINNASVQQVTTPPFWIDMSKLFELYALGLLKDHYPQTGAITYHSSTYGNELDFLINVDGLQMVADAKYKLKYQSNNPNHDDIRQVSGYARLKFVYDRLGKNYNEIIPCLIIYPSGFLNKGERNVINISTSAFDEIEQYVFMYKLGIKLPLLY